MHVVINTSHVSVVVSLINGLAISLLPRQPRDTQLEPIIAVHQQTDERVSLHDINNHELNYRCASYRLKGASKYSY